MTKSGPRQVTKSGDGPGGGAWRFTAGVPAVEQFDVVMFGMSPGEAAFADPQQRLLLTAAHEALAALPVCLKP
eukprot:1195890-Prorocentrum_minimum.AAC.3